MKEKRNLLLTVAGIGISGLGTNLYTFAVSLYILSVTGSATSFSLSLILTTLPRIILNPIAGNLVDRINRKLLVVASDFMSAVVMICLFALTINENFSLSYIYIAGFLLSVLNVMLNNAYVASYANIVSTNYITKLNSTTESIRSLLQIASPILGGLIYALVDIQMFFFINGLSFAISALTELFIDFHFNKSESNSSVETSSSTSFIENFIEGFRYILEQKTYLSLAIYIMAVNFFLSAFTVIVPYTLITIHAFDTKIIGFIEAAFPIGMLLMSLYIGHKNITFHKDAFKKSMIYFAILLIVFSIPSLPMFDFGFVAPVFYGLIFALLAAVAMRISIPLSVKLQKEVDSAYRGRFFGFLGAVTEASLPISYMITGLLIGLLPTYVILLVSSISLLIIARHIHKNRELEETKEVIDHVIVPT